MADAGTNIGTVSLGMKLNDAEFLQQMAKISVEASKIMQRNLRDSVKIPTNALDLSPVNKQIKDIGTSLSDSIKQQTAAIDGIGDLIYENMRTQAEKGLNDGINIGAASVSNKFQDIVKMPKIKPEMDVAHLERMLTIYEDKWRAVDNQRIAQAKKVAAIKQELNSVKVGRGDTTKLQGELANAQKKLVNFKLAAEQADMQVVSLQREIERLKTPVNLEQPINKAKEETKQLGREAKKTGKTITNQMNKAAKSTNGLEKATKKAGHGFKKLLRFGLAMMGIRSVMLGVRRVTRSVGEQLQRMAVNNTAMAKSLDSITKSTDQMKGAFAAAVAPLVQALLPALERLVQLAIKAFNAVAMLLGSLLGLKTVQIATGSTKQFRKDIGGAQKSVNKFKRSLAGFDELQILHKKDTGGSGGGAGELDPGTVFRTVKTPVNKLRSQINILLDMIKKSSAFKGFAKGATKALDNIKKSAERAFDGIKKSWDINVPRIVDSFKNTIQQLDDLVGNLAENLFWPMVEGASTAGIEMAGKLVEGILTITADVVELGSSVLAPIIDSLNEFWDEHGAEVSENILETWIVIKDGFCNIVDGIVDIVHTVFGGITDWFKEHSSEIKELLVTTWETIWGIIKPIWETMREIAVKIFSALSDFFHEIAPKIRDVVVAAFDLMWAIIKPIWETMLRVAKAIFGALQRFWARWGDTIIQIFSTTWNIVKEVFCGALTGITEIMQGLARDIGNIIDGIIGVFDGIIGFLRHVFKGEWGAAWDDIVNVFSNIWKTIKSIFITPLNVIINAINVFIRGLNKIKVPEWVPGIGGKGINIQEIAEIQLAKGGIVEEPTLAMVGERGREVVLPLESHTGWIDALAAKITEKGGTGRDEDINLTQPIYIGTDQLIDIIEIAIDREGRLRNKPVF